MNKYFYAALVFLGIFIGALAALVWCAMNPAYDTGAITMEEYYNRQILDERVKCYRHQYRFENSMSICNEIFPIGEYPDQL